MIYVWRIILSEVNILRLFLIDFGSTFIKYAIYDTSGCDYMHFGKEEFPGPSFCEGNSFLVSTKDIENVIFKLFSIACDYKCSKCFICVQMHGYILTDEKNKYSDYVSWRDESGDITNPLLKNIDFSVRGTSLKSNLPFVKLIGSKASFEGKKYFTLGSYISYVLTGENVTHKTDACAGGFYTADGLLCNDEMFSQIEFPKCCQQVEKIGEYKGMAIYSPVGDHQASFAGSLSADENYFLNIGTASLISCTGRVDFKSKGCENRPYFTDEGLITITGLTGGAKLYKGDNTAEFTAEIINAVSILPRKKTLVVGGGGTESAFELLCTEMNKRGIKCEKARENSGIEGLRILAENMIRSGIMWSEINFPNAPIILKNSGLDFSVIDCEHGAFDYSVLTRFIMTSNLVDFNMIIRLGSNNRENITKLADAGACGLLLPMTSSSSDIAEVVRYSKYMPVGKRGISTTRAHTLYNPPDISEYMISANKKMKVYAQIETVTGVKNASEIINTPGVDGVFIGPNDLSADMGCIGDTEPICKCIKAVAKETKKAGKVWGIITQNKKLIECAKKCGVNMICFGSELNILKTGCKNISKEF